MENRSKRQGCCCEVLNQFELTCRYSGGTLFDVLDNVDPFPRDPLKPFRMSIIDKYKDMGTIAMGKSESGMVSKGDALFVMPNKYVS